MTPSRHLPLDGAFNLRDVGGYPAASGTTRWHTLYRSDSLHQLSDADRAELERRGVQLVIDLRDDEERSAFPGFLAGVSARVEDSATDRWSGSARRQPSTGFCDAWSMSSDRSAVSCERTGSPTMS